MKHWIIITAIVTLSSCAAVRQIDYDYDKSVNFDRLKTFAWMPQQPAPYKDSRYRNEIIESNIKRYVADHFTALGLRIDNQDPDILLTYDLQVEKGEYTREEPIYGQTAMPMMGPMNMAAGMPMMINPMWNDPLHFHFWNRPMMGQMWMPPPQIVGYRTRQIPFKNGTLVVSAHKRSDNRLIWRGWAASCIMDPLEYKRNLEDKSGELVRTYPKDKGKRK